MADPRPTPSSPAPLDREGTRRRRRRPWKVAMRFAPGERWQRVAHATSGSANRYAAMYRSAGWECRVWNADTQEAPDA